MIERNLTIRIAITLGFRNFSLRYLPNSYCWRFPAGQDTPFSNKLNGSTKLEYFYCLARWRSLTSCNTCSQQIRQKSLRNPHLRKAYHPAYGRWITLYRCQGLRIKTQDNILAVVSFHSSAISNFALLQYSSILDLLHNTSRHSRVLLEIKPRAARSVEHIPLS